MAEAAPGEIAVLAAAGRAASGLAAAPRARDASAPAVGVDPGRLFELARLNKMLGVLPLSPAALPPGCASLASRLLQVHLQTVAMNARALAVTAEVVAALHDVPVVVMKGPLQQLALHGTPARRPSGDVDLFVAPRDRRRAAEALRGLGFAALEADRALWWIGFLGEQHFHREADGAVVDLHHRLQQVGLPGWRRAGDVLARREVLRHDGADLPVPARGDSALLLAVTIAKALLAHEPCGWAVFEFAATAGRMTEKDWRTLVAQARAAGQDRTLALACAVAEAVAGPLTLADGRPVPAPGLPTDLMPRDAALLVDLVFQPWRRRRGPVAGGDGGATRRGQMLRMLAGGRPHVLLLEGARAMLSQMLLKQFARRNRS